MKTLWMPVSAVSLALATACAPASLVDVPVPSTVIDPSVVTTPSGAVQLYRMAVGQFARTFGGLGSAGIEPQNMVVASGVWTDELMVVGISGSVNGDHRMGAEGGNNPYGLYQEARSEQQQARQALRLYSPDAPRALRGRLYALEGHTVLWLAEFFCSGIPIPAVPLFGSSSPTRGLTTEELYSAAEALFDSAIVEGVDSVQIVQMAKVGKGRALLGRGRFAEAAEAVRGVPTDFIYDVVYAGGGRNFLGNSPRELQVVDGEGTNGLAWSTDPRTAVVTTPAQSGGMKYSAKYSRTASGTLDPLVPAPSAPIRLADGLEARLIEAEAALASGNTNWLTILNALRATCIATAPCAPVPGLTAPQLPPLADPGTTTGRIDALMRERAMWLFLTGHRQGDLRRLVRLYQREPQTMYPMGTYLNAGFPPQIGAVSGSGTSSYAAVFVRVPPSSERTFNPSYGGCYDLEL